MNMIFWLMKISKNFILSFSLNSFLMGGIIDDILNYILFKERGIAD